jgi:phage terminase large subunit-like protein
MISDNYTYNQYIDDVISGKQAACKHIVNACKRHVKDLNTLDKNVYKFDEEKAQWYIDFIQMLKLSKGVGAAGQCIKLQPWQQFIVASIFGWQHKRDGEWYRRFKKAYIEIPRKNGKTTLATAIALCCFVADREPGPEVYFAATHRGQALQGFNECKQMIYQNEDLSEFLEVFERNIHFKDPLIAGKIEPLSSSKKQSGYNTHAAVVDEVHEHPNRTIIDLLTTSISARTQPLIFEITTSGKDINTICFDHHKMTSDILSGVIKDESWFGVIYSIDKDDDWQLESSWFKANPNLGVPGAKKIDYIRSEFIEATNSPNKTNTFKQLDLNIWVFGGSGWIIDDVWMAISKDDIDWSYVESLPCWAGLDLAQSKDFSSLVLLFFDKDNKKFYTKEYSWCAEQNLLNLALNNEPQLMQWADDGYIKKQHGNIMDADLIEDDIVEILSKLPNFKSLAFDRMFIGSMANHLENKGFKTSEFNQSVKNFAAPTSDIEAQINAGNIIHSGNPVTRWMLSNCLIKNVNDMKKLVRDSRKYKIDSIIAMVQAYGQYMTDTAQDEEQPSPYMDRGIITF